MVVLEGVKEVDSINLIAEKILNVFTEPFSLNNLKFYASINIGISVCPEHSTEVAELVSSAESAMHMSKMQGVNKYQYYLSSFI
jgi:GGDEF domain-containing protein